MRAGRSGKAARRFTQADSMRSQEMPFKITDKCTACGSCADVCPYEAIKPGEEKYEINEEECQECGACVDTCPEGAIVEEEE
jgi:ferredoxin